jgi:hypothetical protein
LAAAIRATVAELDVDLDETARRDRTAEVDGRIALVADVAVIDAHVVTVAAIAAALLCNDQYAPVAVVRGGRPRADRRRENQTEAKNCKKQTSNNMPHNDEPLISCGFSRMGALLMTEPRPVQRAPAEAIKYPAHENKRLRRREARGCMARQPLP